MYSIIFFFLLVALGWGVVLAQGLAGLTPGPPCVRHYLNPTTLGFAGVIESFTAPTTEPTFKKLNICI